MTSAARLLPTFDAESGLAEVLAEIVGVETVSVDSHFFDDLGADSMMMAQFCARVRKRSDLPAVSMKEVYRNPTIRRLASALDADPPRPIPAHVAEPAVAATPAGALEHILCGTLQVLAVFGYLTLVAFVFARGYEWMSAGSGLLDVYLRAVMFGGTGFLGLCALPILAKWLLVGRWTPGSIRVWSLGYVRFWVVKTLVQSNPLVLFTGSPIYAFYLRALGAKIGRNVLIFSRYVPVCTDLLTIGDGAVVRKGAFFACYRARAGLIEIGGVSLGRDALVGEMTVLDIETSLGDAAQLGHASSLHRGQTIPDGERRHGSPANERTKADCRLVGARDRGGLRGTAYSVFKLLTMALVTAPLAVGGVLVLIAAIPQFEAVQGSGTEASSGWTLVGGALALSFAQFFGLLLAGLVLVMTVPRLLNLAVKSDTIYPLYGVRYWAHRKIAAITNIAFFPRLLGDSSYIVFYLRWLGYDLSKVEQTGSNFGLEVRHDTPYLVTVGPGTMAADGLSIINADYSSTSFRVSRATIGARSFIGNYVAYPSQARTGDDCLLATKVLVPVDGDVRKGTGLLGSPEFEIPRSVDRDRKFDHLAHGEEFRRRLAAKDRHNAVTIGLYLLAWWMFFFELILVALVTVDLYAALGAPAIALAGVFIIALKVAHFGLVERLSTMFRPLEPQYCSIYEPYFWWHERYWKLATQPLILNGTPFKALAWRLLGARIGRRVFDDGCIIMEKTLVAVGDDCALNFGSIIQPHSQENGAFKSDRIAIGAGCTIGTGALVHYGVTMGDGVELAPDSFLMKGEEVPPRARWGGNPAREIRRERPAAPLISRARTR